MIFLYLCAPELFDLKLKLFNSFLRLCEQLNCCRFNHWKIGNTNKL